MHWPPLTLEVEVAFASLLRRWGWHAQLSWSGGGIPISLKKVKVMHWPPTLSVGGGGIPISLKKMEVSRHYRHSAKSCVTRLFGIDSYMPGPGPTLMLGTASDG
jgi:hypothetical protein